MVGRQTRRLCCLLARGRQEQIRALLTIPLQGRRSIFEEQHRAVGRQVRRRVYGAHASQGRGSARKTAHKCAVVWPSCDRSGVVNRDRGPAPFTRGKKPKGLEGVSRRRRGHAAGGGRRLGSFGSSELQGSSGRSFRSSCGLSPMRSHSAAQRSLERPFRL